MKPLSIIFGVIVIARLAFAQTGTGYNYPSPFNQLTPGTNDLGIVPAQQPFGGSAQPGFNNPQFGGQPSPPIGAGPPSTLQPGFNPQFVQSTPSSLAPVPGHSPGTHGSGFVPPSPQPSGFPAPQNAGFPSTIDGNANFGPSAPPTSSSFPHSGSGFGSHSTHSAGGSFPGPSQTNFGGPSIQGGGGNIGQPAFNQGGNFGGSNDFGSNGEGNGDYSAIPGTAGVDYPIYTEIPKTSFDCRNQPLPGYYADVEAQCQVFHICALNTTFNFLCPNGTIFSQEHLVCVWWNQFDCNSAPALYGNNANIYDYSKTGQQQNTNQGFGGQEQIGGFNNNIPGIGIDQSQTPGFGPSQSPGFGPSAGGLGGSPGFGAPGSLGSGNFGPSSHSQGSHSSGSHSPGSHSPGSSHSGYAPSHSQSPGFIPPPQGGSVAPSVGFPSPNIPSSGSEQYPIAPPSQIPDFNQAPVIAPTGPSSPTPFGVSVSPIPSVTGYPAAGPPSSINTPQLGGQPDQPSREYLPGRRTI